MGFFVDLLIYNSSEFAVKDKNKINSKNIIKDLKNT